MSAEHEITRLLREQREGPEAAARLYRAVYERLRSLARGRLGGRASGRTLGTTALVHEAYLKLVDQTQVDWKDRNHFFAVAATAMRQIVIDDARRKAAKKRGAAEAPLELDEERVGVGEPVVDLIALDEALGRLERLDPRLCRVVEMRFFAGYSVEETAAALGSSERTVKRDWRKARALLYRDLSRFDEGAEPGGANRG